MRSVTDTGVKIVLMYDTVSSCSEIAATHDICSSQSVNVDSTGWGSSKKGIYINSPFPKNMNDKFSLYIHCHCEYHCDIRVFRLEPIGPTNI